MSKMHLNNVRYEVTYYDGQDISTQVLSRRKAVQLDPRGFDYFLSVSMGLWFFRTAEGEWVEHHDGIWPGFGNTCIKIVRATQLNTPEFVTPEDIAAVTGYNTLRNNNALSARWKAIRVAHQEDFRQPNFFLSRRSGGFGVAWNPNKTFCWVERIPSGPAGE